MSSTVLILEIESRALNKAVARGLLENSFWFRDWPTEKKARLMAHSEIRPFVKGDLVYRDIEQKELLLLIAGSLWCRLHSQGQASGIGLMYPGALVGLTQILNDLSPLDACFEFVAASEFGAALAIPTADFIDIVEARPSSWRAMAEAVVQYQRTCLQLVTCMHLGPIRSRVLAALHQFGLSALDPDAPQAPVCIDLSQEELATIIHSSRQHVNKSLRALESEGLVRIGYKRIEIPDPQAFFQIARALKLPLVGNSQSMQ